MKRDKITVEIEGYFKKGDDFSFYLKEWSPVKALEMWGKDLENMGKALQKGAEILKDREIETDACTHMARIYNIDRATAEKLFSLGFFYQDWMEKEHESCDPFCDFCHDMFCDETCEDCLEWKASLNEKKENTEKFENN